ncbi:MAG: ATP-binding protein [Solirubrobacteraceae bacterium]
MTPALAQEMFVGRAAELALLGDALERARAAQPVVALVQGPAGIGKTALIKRFVQTVGELTVLRVGGDELETLVPYALVDQLLCQAGAIDPALLTRRADRIVDPVDAGSRVLEALGALQREEPVLLVADDAQHVDAQSLCALVFALRRLVVDRVLAIVAARDDRPTTLPEGFRRLADREPATAVRLGPLDATELVALAAGIGVAGFTHRAARRLRDHTAGNPLHARALLAELPDAVWQGPLSRLPPPRSFEAIMVDRLGLCSTAARNLVEAASVLGLRSRLGVAGAVAGLPDPMPALDEAFTARLLTTSDESDEFELAFGQPLEQAAVYSQLSPSRRTALHLAAAAATGDEWAGLHHRAAAVATSDGALAAELERFAFHETARGAWAHASASLVAAGRVSPTLQQAQTHLLRAVDSMLYRGDVAQAIAHADEIAGFPATPLRDCVLGFLAILTSRPDAAERLLAQAWANCDRDRDPRLASTIARRTALHFQYRLRGSETLRWSRRALELVPAEERSCVQAEMLPLGLGAAYAGRLGDGIAAVQSAIDSAGESERGGCVTLRRARGWLRLVGDDFAGARADLGDEAAAALAIGSLGVAAFAIVHLARLEHTTGNWDRAVVHAERAIAITSELEHPFIALAGLAAATVAATRGDWDAAQESVARTATHAGDYEQALVAAGIARAQLASARADHADVLLALAPVLEIEPREGVDEPGCWPWQHLYGEALVATDRAAEADEFLAGHEALAAARGRESASVRLAIVRGRVSAALGDHQGAGERLEWAVEHAHRAAMPFDRAIGLLAHGQVLRRRGHRRAAVSHLERARIVFEQLGARPYRERCEAELRACGLAPAKRRGFDRDRLTPQETAVARLVASGLANRQVATELVVSVRTVEFHLTRIYGKLGVSSRAQLVALATRIEGIEGIEGIGR